MNELPRPLSFWSTVRLLLRAARRRSAGRRERQQELLRQRSNRAVDFGPFGVLIATLVMLAINILAAFFLRAAVRAAERVDTENQGQIVVSSEFLQTVKAETNASTMVREEFDSAAYHREARRIAEAYGGSQEAIEQKLHDAVRDHGAGDFVSENDATPGLTALPSSRSLTALVGSLALLFWGAMLVFQGEGLEFDLQRRRHPMWEWLFSHPVPPGAIFMAEMLSPIAANPIYWGAPIFVGFVYGFAYDFALGVLAMFLVGIPLTLALACLGKAFEIGVMLRFSPRSRGAMIGLMSWMGYASMMLCLLGLYIVEKAVSVAAKFLGLFTVLPSPWLGLFLGRQSDGSFSFLIGVVTTWIFSAVAIATAVRFSIWGANQGLAGNTIHADVAPSASKGGARFGKEPLYRKEFLWFVRDRSALVQTILIPITVASAQLFNFRYALKYANSAWNYLCGAGILFGTYFLWVLGPRSLASEGQALWIALTWPRGLESLLKAKAWLWSMISTVLVGLVLCYAAFLFPANTWQILLVGVGWFFFGRSMAEKTVTLVSVPSSSGETEKIPWQRRWAAQLGMLTFAIGLLTQQWHVAVIGIVYSFITAAAMWENFRARLPYLFDPWSEKLPPAPTLMHAMISISILVEAGAVLTGMLVVFSGGGSIAIAQAISYGICAVGVSVGVASFLSDRDVSRRDVWLWRPTRALELQAEDEKSGLIQGLLLGALGGLALGLLAMGYLAALHHIPAVHEILRKTQEQLANSPTLRISYAVMAVGFAPFAEEYLFRGLLFRALDREWGGWRAVLGSAAFFAIYHPALAWLPVGLLGAANALLFKKTGRLASAVVLHMVYNAVVVLLT